MSMETSGSIVDSLQGLPDLKRVVFTVLSHNYRYQTIDSRQKQVKRDAVGDLRKRPLAETWMSEEYGRFRSAVRAFHFPSCPDCELRASRDLRERNEGCWGWNPACADCLWAQDIVRCP